MSPVFLTMVPGRLWDPFWGSHSPLVSGNPHGAPHMPFGNLLVPLEAAASTASCSRSRRLFTFYCLSWAPAFMSHLSLLSLNLLLFSGFCSICSPDRYLPYWGHSFPLFSMKLCLLNKQSPSFFGHWEAALLFCVLLFSKGPHTRIAWAPKIY